MSSEQATNSRTLLIFLFWMHNLSTKRNVLVSQDQPDIEAYNRENAVRRIPCGQLAAGGSTDLNPGHFGGLDSANLLWSQHPLIVRVR